MHLRLSIDKKSVMYNNWSFIPITDGCIANDKLVGNNTDKYLDLVLCCVLEQPRVLVNTQGAS